MKAVPPREDRLVLELIGVDRSDPLPNPQPIEEAPH